MKLLLSRGIDKNALTSTGFSYVLCSIFGQHLDILEYLVSQNFPLTDLTPVYN